MVLSIPMNHPVPSFFKSYSHHLRNLDFVTNITIIFACLSLILFSQIQSVETVFLIEPQYTIITKIPNPVCHTKNIYHDGGVVVVVPVSRVSWINSSDLWGPDMGLFPLAFLCFPFQIYGDGGFMVQAAQWIQLLVRKWDVGTSFCKQKCILLFNKIKTSVILYKIIYNIHI